MAKIKNIQFDSTSCSSLLEGSIDWIMNDSETTLFKNQVMQNPDYLDNLYITISPKGNRKRGNFPGLFNTENGPIWIKKVIYNKQTTVVFWSDNSITKAKCESNDFFSPEAGLSICILKKLIGINETIDILNTWIDNSKNEITLKDIRKKK